MSGNSNVLEGTSLGSASNNINVSFKIPGQTGWLDVAKDFTYNDISVNTWGLANNKIVFNIRNNTIIWKQNDITLTGTYKYNNGPIFLGTDISYNIYNNNSNTGTFKCVYLRNDIILKINENLLTCF